MPLKLARQSAVNGQVLKWNSTTWSPANDDTGIFSLPFEGSVNIDNSGFKITNTNTGNNTSAIYGISSSATSGIGIFGTALKYSVYGNADATSGETYGVYGITESPSGYGVLGKGILQGILGRATATSGEACGIRGDTPSSSGIGVKGVANSASGSTIGVFGIASSNNGTGVYGTGGKYGIYGVGEYGISGYSAISTGIGLYGSASHTSGINYGIWGQSNSSLGTGVYGTAPLQGVYGSATATSGTTFGVYGYSSANSGYGVYGLGNTGVYGKGNDGVYGVSSSTTGRGIYGSTTSTTGVNFAVMGEAASESGSGVYGYAKSATGSTYGLKGISASTGGTGVYALASANSGTTVGVYGAVLSSTGYSGYFSGGRFFIGGNVGIGVDSPSEKLAIDGNLYFTPGVNRYIFFPDKTMSLFIGGNGGIQSAYAIHLITDNGSGSGEARISIVSDKVGIGTTNPFLTLDVNGNARFRSVSSGTFAYNLNLTSDGTLTTATSDITMKENINQITHALEKVTELRGVTFNWKNDPAEVTQIGMIAQEVEKILPEVVFTNPVDGLKGINYSQTTALLVEAIKEQEKQIESFKSQIKSLQDKVDQIETILEKGNIK